ncbi:MAG TPA: ABC transporter permease [bacterium]|nr:ABC transporter permease [bacterium]HNT66198.1 ABC transporter permease [bacterium]HOX86238.1 ABC transporter permease [bacterium]HPG45548.1 ABC transporter permease [bacterium]HPM97673.1 ABC transporter permease [bacterium]
MNSGIKTFGAVGRSAGEFFAQVARVADLARQTLYWSTVGAFRYERIRWNETFTQMVRIGVNSLPIVGMISFFVGLIIAMQSAYQLERFGAVVYVADLVGVSITRELGPLITAIIITGRSGSAIAAELGTMKVSEEIDALQTMAINPVSFLVVPRTLAMLIMLPCLTIMADFLGLLGGFVLGVVQLQIPYSAYFSHTADAILFKDFFTGLSKSVLFAFIIALIGAYQGLHVRGGAEGVGKSTTDSVVTSIFLVILSDVLFTALFFSTF